MTNWRRVFRQFVTQIRWLHSYAQMNEIAIREAQRKFMKNFFAVPDNTLNYQLNQIVGEKLFLVGNNDLHKDFVTLSKDLLEFYS